MHRKKRRGRKEAKKRKKREERENSKSKNREREHLKWSQLKREGRIFEKFFMCTSQKKRIYGQKLDWVGQKNIYMGQANRPKLVFFFFYLLIFSFANLGEGPGLHWPSPSSVSDLTYLSCTITYKTIKHNNIKF
jgi:hypothetical protein